MAASEIATLASVVTNTASTIQELGNNWYRASAAWEEFPHEVERLRSKQEFWKAEFTKVGMLSDRALIDTLREAELQLKQEEDKLLKRSASCGAGCWPKLIMTTFPAQLGSSIGGVITAFDQIAVLLKNEEEAAAALEKRALRRPFSLFFRRDDRYVPMQDSETAVHSALDNVELVGPVVVLLHGGAGKGKSTLARAVALDYKEAADKAFDHVVYLECGPQADLLGKQFNLLQLLGTVASVPQSDSGSDLTILKRIRTLLRDQKVLIVFDDVWEAEFLQRMVDLCGTSVKCLVTSQLGDLCRGLNCSSIDIQIEDVQPKDARKMLATHLALQDHLIPENLKEIADKMIRETEGNPLALASIAAAIDHKRNNDLDAWEAASNNLLGMLECESHEYILNMKYPRSFWATMKLSFQSLEKDAQNLLVLVHMCGGVSVPEEVIYLLYCSTKVRFGPVAFMRLRTELENRELVKVSESLINQRSWSIHSLQKQFIEEHMKDAKETTFTMLMSRMSSRSSSKIGSQVELEIVKELPIGEDLEAIKIILVGLYFHDEFAMRAKKVVKNIGIPCHRLNNLTCSAIEPVTRLLGKPLSSRWTEKLHTSTKQVFMGYICNNALDDVGISELLGSPISTQAMITTIQDIVTIEEKIVLDDNAQCFMKALVGLLEGPSVESDEDVNVQETAGRAIDHICNHQVRSVYILSKFPSVLKVVVKLLSTNSNPKIRSCSASILASLTVSGEVNGLQEIVQYPMAIAVLVKSLSQENNPSLQENAAFALANLAFNDGQMNLEVIHSLDVIEELTKSLSMDDNPNLQEQAARALANLAHHRDGQIKFKIIGAIEELVKWLSKDHYLSLQEEVARSLANLSGGDIEIQLTIANSLGAIEKLVKLLSKDHHPHLQEVAARTLANLASADSTIGLKIANSLGAIEELVKWLSKDENPGFQEEVARALANLTSGDGKTLLKIANSLGAIEKMLKLLSKNHNPDLQKHVACALANIIGGDDDIGLRIANTLGAIEELVKWLSEDHNPDLQEEVVRALANLTSADGETRLKIANALGAIEELVKLLSKDHNPYLQEQAAFALANIAGGDDQIGLKIVNSPGAIEELVKWLSKDENPNLQEEVARAFANLTGGDVGNGLKIANSLGSIEQLLKLLSKDDNPNLQKKAAMALANLTCGDDEVKLKIINSLGIVEGLVRSLSKEDNPDLQKQAAFALASLASGNDEIGLKIANSFGAIEELVKWLSKEDNPDLREEVARTLANLAGGYNESGLKIVECLGAIEELLNLLSKDDNPNLQKRAAMTLANLTFGDSEVKLSITHSKGAIEELVKCLSKNDNPSLQKHAAIALGNLTEGDYEIELKGLKIAKS